MPASTHSKPAFRPLKAAGLATLASLVVTAVALTLPEPPRPVTQTPKRVERKRGATQSRPAPQLPSVAVVAASLAEPPPVSSVSVHVVTPEAEVDGAGDTARLEPDDRHFRPAVEFRSYELHGEVPVGLAERVEVLRSRL